MQWFLNLINLYFVQRIGEYMKHIRCFRLDMLLVDNKQQLTLNLVAILLCCMLIFERGMLSRSGLMSYFSFHDVPNQVWLNRSGLQPAQYLDTFTTKPCPCNSSSMGFSTVLPKYLYATASIKRISNLDGSICGSNIIFTSEKLSNNSIKNIQAGSSSSIYWNISLTQVE